MKIIFQNIIFLALLGFLVCSCEDDDPIDPDATDGIDFMELPDCFDGVVDSLNILKAYIYSSPDSILAFYFLRPDCCDQFEFLID